MTAFTIGGKPGYTPTTFIIDDDFRVYVENAEIGFFRHKAHENTEILKNHLFNMVMEGFYITPIKAGKRYRKMIDDFKKEWGE